jgi:transcriptional regulator with XRE-family HTH domain
MARKLEENATSVDAIEAELGRRLEAVRLAANVSQAELAAEAGVSRRTITRLENGGGVSVDTLIRVMRALGLAGRFESLLPDPDVRPVDRVRLQGRQRQRARPTARPSRAAEWTWADDTDGDDS